MRSKSAYRQGTPVAQIATECSDGVFSAEKMLGKHEPKELLQMSYFYDLLALGQWGLSSSSWALFCLAVFIVGFSKTGLPGITIVAVPLMAMVLPAKISVGVLLPIYMIADLISVWSYWRFAQWRCCFPYLIFVGLGIWAASFVVGAVDDRTFGVVIGWVVLVLILLNVALDAWRAARKTGVSPVETASGKEPSLATSAFFGLSAGLVSALANAAGPIVTLYMIVTRLEKFQFLGTTAVCAFVMNWIKVPLFLSLGSINLESLKLDVAAIPIVVLGGLAGIVFARKLPQKAFKNIVLVFAFLASLKLIAG